MPVTCYRHWFGAVTMPIAYHMLKFGVTFVGSLLVGIKD